MEENTKLIKAGQDFTNNSGAVMEPVYRTSTILFPNFKSYTEANSDKFIYKHNFNAFSPDYSYAISGTPTTFALQEAVSKIENTKYSLIYPSGLSSLTSVLLSLLESGDHILITDSVYSPIRRFCSEVLKKLNIEIEYYKASTGEDIASLIKDNTKIIFIETPGSLTFEMQDISSLTSVARAKNIITMADNSWATGIFLNPFNYGVDISIQAGTKYIGGHSDIFLGVATTNNDNIFKKMSQFYRNAGIHVSPDVCYLGLRGLKTLHTRLKTHESSALKIAKWLETRPEVEEVLHPALESFKGHDLWKKYFSGSGGLFSIKLNKEYSFEALSNMVDNCKVFAIGASWGGYESLILPFDLKKTHNNKSYIRIYTGLESISDLQEDIEKALDRLIAIT